MQQRQLPQSTSEQALPEVIAIRRQRTRRAQLSAVGLAGALLALLVTGCPEPADLANPESYDKPPPAAGEPCEVACVKNIFQVSAALCKGCHGGMIKSSELDLALDGFTQRLKGQPAKHKDIVPAPAAGDCPTGDKLIDVDDPSKSWLLKKVKGDQGKCGIQMPSTPLSAMDMSCMETYVYCVAGKAPPAGGSGGSGGSGTGGSSSGSGGSSSGSGGSSSGSGGSSSGSGGTGSN